MVRKGAVMKAHKIEVSVFPKITKTLFDIPEAEFSAFRQARLDALPPLNNAPKAAAVVDQPARKKRLH